MYFSGTSGSADPCSAPSDINPKQWPAKQRNKALARGTCQLRCSQSSGPEGRQEVALAVRPGNGDKNENRRSGGPALLYSLFPTPRGRSDGVTRIAQHEMRAGALCRESRPITRESQLFPTTVRRGSPDPADPADLCP